MVNGLHWHGMLSGHVLSLGLVLIMYSLVLKPTEMEHNHFKSFKMSKFGRYMTLIWLIWLFEYMLGGSSLLILNIDESAHTNQIGP